MLDAATVSMILLKKKSTSFRASSIRSGIPLQLSRMLKLSSEILPLVSR